LQFSSECEPSLITYTLVEYEESQGNAEKAVRKTLKGGQSSATGGKVRSEMWTRIPDFGQDG
jgi:hypothetical protein